MAATKERPEQVPGPTRVLASQRSRHRRCSTRQACEDGRVEGDGSRGQLPGESRSLRLDPLDAQLRQVEFFDTPDLDLNKAGVVVRSRRSQGGPDDTVIKLRPVVPADLPAELPRCRSSVSKSMRSGWLRVLGVVQG